ncbi:pyrimidine utilization protein D [Sphingomonas sp. GM_Shp_1]|uniref:pyrimidine utilization protein D n=1 Tax=Sphingomonas sp. GM_Shp_1 TaxID=2937381 RepID=UPI00226B073B|nr:pyrimidine utilization protein D [Sphingomonas sp. GM_Shp_1]
MAEAAGLYYELHGPEAAPPLILSSGLGGSATYWAPNLPALAQAYRVLVYDHRGPGRSDRALPDVVTVEDMAGDLLALMDALDIESARFIGHALGGMIGIEAAIASTRIDSLVVVNGWRKLDPHTRRCFDVRLDLLRDSGPAAFLHAQPLFLYPPDWISANSDRLADEAAHQLANFPGRATVEKRIAAVCAYDPKLIDITATANWLVIGTRDDMLVPWRSAVDVATPLAWANKAVLDWGGHACNVTDPDRFNRLVLDFLRS